MAESSIVDTFKHLNMKLNPDGSVTFPIVPPTETPILPNFSTISKDIPLNPSNKTFLRLYKPHNIPQIKLPILIYGHGGGFIFFSVASEPFHRCCCLMAAHFPAIVVSVEYRLAPEHRLPAAYDDAVEAIHWLRRQAVQINNGGGGDSEPWLRDCADFSRCFLYGSSAGANITFNAALRALDSDLSPVKLVGHIYNQPFFGGIERTESELRGMDDRILPTAMSDMMWGSALPEDCDRSHWFCDPTVEGPHQDKIGRLGRCLVRGHGGDPLVDRQKEFVKLLEARGVHVEAKFFEGGFHGLDLFDPSKLQALLDDVKDFMDKIHR